MDAEGNALKPTTNGWKLRKAYSFLDDIMERDVQIIQKQMRKSKSKIKKQCLREEIIKIKNRINTVKEKDLQQHSKATLRKEDMLKVSNGQKNPFFIKISDKQLNGSLKHPKQQPHKIQVKQEYLKHKFSQLKNDGRLDKYMRKRRKKVNSKFKQAFSKKSGQGWLDK